MVPETEVVPFLSATRLTPFLSAAPKVTVKLVLLVMSTFVVAPVKAEQRARLVWTQARKPREAS